MTRAQWSALWDSVILVLLIATLSWSELVRSGLGGEISLLRSELDFARQVAAAEKSQRERCEAVCR